MWPRPHPWLAIHLYGKNYMQNPVDVFELAANSGRLLNPVSSLTGVATQAGKSWLQPSL